MTKTKYFVKCDNCGKKIYIDEKIFKFPGFCGIYCSPECFAEQHAEEGELTLEECHNSRCVIYKEEIKEIVVEQASDPVEVTDDELEQLLK